MKKILLICNHFAPDNTIAAIRTTKLAKYFVKEGFSVKVIAEKKYDRIEDDILKKDAEGIEVIRVENTKRCRCFVKKYKEWIAPYKRKRLLRLDNRIRINPKTGRKEFYPYETAYPFLGSLDFLAEIYRQRDLFLQAREILNHELDYDIVITSYGDWFGIYAGYYIKRKNKKITWILDIRDAIYRYKFTPKFVAWYARLTERITERRADWLVAVSRGIAKRVSQKYRNKVRIITNGYDRADRRGIKDTRVGKEKLIFTYTGSMYGGIRDLSPFFNVLGELIQSGKIDRERIEIDYAGNEPAYQIFLGQAEKYKLAGLCEYRGKMDRKGSLQLQMNSDVLLVASYDYVMGEGGVLTGKALEYMSANKPVITIINGDIVNSELRRIMEECNLGCVYEESNHKADSDRLKNYIQNIYEQFLENENIEFAPDARILERYNYANICSRYIKLINGKGKS